MQKPLLSYHAALWIRSPGPRAQQARVTVAAPEALAAVALFSFEGIRGDDGEVPQELRPSTNPGVTGNLRSRKPRTLRQERPTWRIPVTGYVAPSR